MRADLQYPVTKEQTVLGYAERVTGQSDMNMGRTQDRPNAPRTARQTIALLEEGDVRASLDTRALREDWGTIIEHWWDLVCMYAPKDQFFRVTEEDAGGLFATAEGGSTLSEEDRFGRYDFDLKFATNSWSKQQKKEDELALYQIDLQNPLIIGNPRALWMLLDKVHRAFGDDRFGDILPEPPDLGLPVKPIEEWTRMLEHEQVEINPLDNDDLHILDHQFRLKGDMASESPNLDAELQMKMHILEHIQQKQQKQQMAMMAQQAVQAMARMPQSQLALMGAGMSDPNAGQQPGGAPPQIGMQQPGGMA